MSAARCGASARYTGCDVLSRVRGPRRPPPVRQSPSWALPPPPYPGPAPPSPPGRSLKPLVDVASGPSPCTRDRTTACACGSTRRASRGVVPSLTDTRTHRVRTHTAHVRPRDTCTAHVCPRDAYTHHMHTYTHSTNTHHTSHVHTHCTCTHHTCTHNTQHTCLHMTRTHPPHSTRAST